MDQGRNAKEMDGKTAVGELVKGLESASKLQLLLQELASGDSDSSSELTMLVLEVHGSFCRALSALQSAETAAEAAGGEAMTPCSEEQKSETSSKKRKISAPRRSGYRRRAHPYTCRRVLSNTTEDGYTWRKYGQKEIYNAKHPRNYYRCTHKYDRNCHATRQVQKSEEDPSMFVITYMGEHTCMDACKSLDQKSPYIISFESDAGTATTSSDQKEGALPSPFPDSPKQECDEEVLSNLTPDSSSSEPLVFPDFCEIEATAMAQFAAATFEQCDVTSSFHSSASSLDIEFNPEGFEFDDVFSFSQDEYFN